MQVPIEVFRVKKGKRYRFRIVNSVSHACAVSLEIQGHSLTVLSSDSFDIQPVTVEKIISNAGERFDFVINVVEDGNYWMRVAGLGICEILQLEQYALLTSKTGLMVNNPAFDVSSIPSRDKILNVLHRVCHLLSYLIMHNL